jgi:hypothetical protein
VNALLPFFPHVHTISSLIYSFQTYLEINSFYAFLRPLVALPVLVLIFSSTLSYQTPSISVRPWSERPEFHTKVKPLTKRNSGLIYVTFSELSSYIQQAVCQSGVQRADRLTLPFHTHEPDLHVRYVQHTGISSSNHSGLMYGIIQKSCHIVELSCRKRAAG